MIGRDQWEQHPHWGSQTLLLGSHEAFRRRSLWIIERIGSLARDQPARARRWVSRMSTDFDWWMSGMSGHERYEERKLYPVLAAHYDTSFPELLEGHEQLHHHRDLVRDAFRAAMASDAEAADQLPLLLHELEAHRAVLIAHLFDEENRVIPLLLELSPKDFSKFFGG